MSPKKICILGAGLAGVTQAYFLASSGYDVEIIDKASEAAADTSHSNGCQLSFTYAEPWASLASISKMPQWLLDPESPLVFRPQKDWRMWAWGLKFFLNSSPGRNEENARNMLRLGIYSKSLLEKIRTMTGIKFADKREGILYIFEEQKTLDKMVRHYKKFGVDLKVHDRAGCEIAEPALKNAGKKIAGGFQTLLDETGDAKSFTLDLLKYCQENYGVKVHFNHEILDFMRDGKDKIAAVKTDKGEIEADAFVLALGPYAPVLARKLGISLPIYPVKGYSLTLPAGKNSVHSSITDADRKIVFTRIGDKLRVAGTAEICGYNHDVDGERINQMIEHTKFMFPDMDVENSDKWACLRAQTPEATPVLGKSKYKNFYLNTGHGTLGWTQAAGSGKILLDIIEGREPEIAMDGLGLR